MATDRLFTHPNFGKQARVEVWGREVRLIFVADNTTKANDLANYVVNQMAKGSINITMMGLPTDIEET